MKDVLVLTMGGICLDIKEQRQIQGGEGAHQLASGPSSWDSNRAAAFCERFVREDAHSVERLYDLGCSP